jgi:hypothetical protein
VCGGRKFYLAQQQKKIGAGVHMCAALLAADSPKKAKLHASGTNFKTHCVTNIYKPELEHIF